MRNRSFALLFFVAVASLSGTMAHAYCPQPSDLSVLPTAPQVNQSFQIRLISRLQPWVDGTVQASVSGNQILVVGRNATGPGIPLPIYTTTIEMPGLAAGAYTIVVDIVESTGQVVQCPRFTVPLTIAGAPPQEARAAPALSPPILAALLVLLLGGGLVAVRRQG